MPEGLQEGPIGNEAGIEDLGPEEVAIEGWQFEVLAQAFVGEGFPQHSKALPEVGVVGAGPPGKHQPPQPLQPIPVRQPIQRMVAHQTPLLRHQQKQKPIHQPQKLPIQFVGREGLCCPLFCPEPCPQPLAQMLIVGMAHKAISQYAQGLLDIAAQAAAYAPALPHRMLIVLLQIAFVGLCEGGRQAGNVQEPVQYLERLEALFLQDACQVKLHIRLAADVVGIAQKAQVSAIGNQPPKVLGAVEELLQEDVGGIAGPGVRVYFSQFLEGGDDMDGWGFLGGAGAMRDAKGRFSYEKGLWVRVQLVPEQAEEGSYPELGGVGGGEACGRVGMFQPAFEDGPELAGFGEGGDHVAEEVGGGVEVVAEVVGFLAGELGFEEGVGDVGSEEAAFPTDEGCGAGAESGAAHGSIIQGKGDWVGLGMWRLPPEESVVRLPLEASENARERHGKGGGVRGFAHFRNGIRRRPLSPVVGVTPSPDPFPAGADLTPSHRVLTLSCTPDITSSYRDPPIPYTLSPLTKGGKGVGNGGIPHSPTLHFVSEEESLA